MDQAVHPRHAATARAARGRVPPAGNPEIAAALNELADLLDLKNDNPFRIRAYRNAARTVGALGHDIAALVASGRELPKLPGIGEDLAGKIAEIAQTGECSLLRKLRREVPPTIVQLLKIPGLGPRRVQALYRDLGIETPQQLLAAAQAGRIKALPRFGAKLEARLVAAAEQHLQAGHRTMLAQAGAQAERYAEYLRGTPGVGEVTVAGSVRRARDTVGDVDLLAHAEDAGAAMTQFVAYPLVREVLSKGPTRSSVVLQSGLQADLRVVARSAYGAALVYFTGSKAHNIAIRRRALSRGLKLSEYGVFRGRHRIGGDSEASVYAALGLPWIPPELREDRGEIEAAAAAALPHLVARRDLKGDLHAHTNATDGQNTLEEMAHAARDAGLSYLAITDHTHHLAVAHGLDAGALLRQAERIDRLNERLDGFTLLKGVEVDILDSGELDLPGDVLRRLDVVIIAIHSHLDLPPGRQMQRLLRALDHPYVTILAHPSGRLLDQRPAMRADLSSVIAAARQRGCALELNCQPDRLDLWDTHLREAKDQGVPIAIDTDAHGTGAFANLALGIGQARRGWLEPGDVLNTRPLAQLKPWLKACFR